MLTAPLPDLAAWTAYLRDREIPIFRESAQAIAELIADEDRVSAHEIGLLAERDPLLTLRILVLAARHRPSRVVTDAETAVTAVVMMGIGRFIEDFHDPAVVEDLLAQDPIALAGLQAVIKRAYRAGAFALAFAVHRLDTDAEVIQEAALLHDFAEMLVWCRAPALARQMRRLLRDDPALRSSSAQKLALNVKLQELRQALAKAWRLPEQLSLLTDRTHRSQARVRNVLLAVDLARHSQYSWENPAIEDDLASIGELLNLSIGAARRKVFELDT